MQTLYIDVYFLINFSVDLLALYFSSCINRLSVSVWRLVVSAVIGALQAVAYSLFFSNSLFGIILSAVSILIMLAVLTNGVSFARRVKCVISFLIIEMLIGGAVYNLYLLMDKYLVVDEDGIGVENRNLLLLSVMVLLVIGVLKLTVTIFSTHKNHKVARVMVAYNGAHIQFDALVDSGNLAVDPIDKTPVMFVQKQLFKKIFGCDVLPCESLKKYTRIIPINTGESNKIRYGIKYKEVYLINKNRKDKLSLVIVIDDKDDFAGYTALMPGAALTEI